MAGFVSKCIFLNSILIFVSASPVLAAPTEGPEALQSLHEKVAHLLDGATPESPFYLHAEARKHIESGDAAFYVPEPFDRMSGALSDVASWCELLPLHLNIKGCIYDASADDVTLTLYLGHKDYQGLEDAHPIEYEFTSTSDENYLEAKFHADKGPMGTSDYRIEFEAMPVGENTFARLRTSEHQSWVSSKAMQVYLKTKGAHKQGISLAGYDDAGRPRYSTGEQGAIERNVLRYYFALVAFFDTINLPAEKRFESSLDYWFEATRSYPQLYEMDRDEYISAKRRERANQLAAQD